MKKRASDYEISLEPHRICILTTLRNKIFTSFFHLYFWLEENLVLAKELFFFKWKIEFRTIALILVSVSTIVQPSYLSSFVICQ